jgi:hypothetical protein
MYLFNLKSGYNNAYHRLKKALPQVLFYKKQKASSGGKVKYRDLWVRLTGSFAASHFIEILGRDESLFFLLLQKFYYIDVLSGFCIAFVIWEIISRASTYLDKRFAWEEQTLARALLQITLGVFVPSVFLHLLTYLQFTYIIGQQMSETSWYTYELPVGIMIIVLINTYYLTYYFFSKYQQLKHNAAIIPEEVIPVPAPVSRELASAKKKRQVFIISKGQRNIPLPVADIAYFYTKDENNYLRTFANEAFLVDESLEDIYSHVDEQLFFRANRQIIINFNACKYFSYLEHGKLQVALQPDTDEPVIISQKRSPLFKEWVRR